jgi:hypothetical protein
MPLRKGPTWEDIKGLGSDSSKALMRFLDESTSGYKDLYNSVSGPNHPKEISSAEWARRALLGKDARPDSKDHVRPRRKPDEFMDRLAADAAQKVSGGMSGATEAPEMAPDGSSWQDYYDAAMGKDPEKSGKWRNRIGDFAAGMGQMPGYGASGLQEFGFGLKNSMGSGTARKAASTAAERLRVKEATARADKLEERDYNRNQDERMWDHRRATLAAARAGSVKAPDRHKYSSQAREDLEADLLAIMNSDLSKSQKEVASHEATRKNALQYRDTSFGESEMMANDAKMMRNNAFLRSPEGYRFVKEKIKDQNNGIWLLSGILDPWDTKLTPRESEDAIDAYIAKQIELNNAQKYYK